MKYTKLGTIWITAGFLLWLATIDIAVHCAIGVITGVPLGEQASSLVTAYAMLLLVFAGHLKDSAHRAYSGLRGMLKQMSVEVMPRSQGNGREVPSDHGGDVGRDGE